MDVEPSEEAPAYELLSCNGRTGMEAGTLMVRLYLDECKTQALVHAIQAGLGPSGVCAVLSSGGMGLFCKIAATILATGASTINAVDALGGHRGIIITYIPGLLSTPIWHQ